MGPGNEVDNAEKSKVLSQASRYAQIAKRGLFKMTTISDWFSSLKNRAKG